MSYRSAKFVSAILAGIFAGANLSAVAGDAASPTDTCLSGPKGALPEGGHWYYRIDRVTKRHCWYLGEEKDKTAKAAPRNSSSSAAAANSAPPQQNNDVRQSIADARAELPLPQARVEQDNGGLTGGQRIPAQAANVENSPGVNPGDESPQRSVIASRWPESSGVNALPAARTVNTDTRPRSNSKAVPAPAPTAISLAAADASPEKQSGSIQMLLLVIVGALSLAGLMGSMIYRFGGMRYGRREIRRERHAIWDLAGTDRLSAATSTADDPKTRIADMVARLSRSPAT